MTCLMHRGCTKVLESLWHVQALTCLMIRDSQYQVALKSRRVCDMFRLWHASWFRDSQHQVVLKSSSWKLVCDMFRLWHASVTEVLACCNVELDSALEVLLKFSEDPKVTNSVNDYWKGAKSISKIRPWLLKNGLNLQSLICAFGGFRVERKNCCWFFDQWASYKSFKINKPK